MRAWALRHAICHWNQKESQSIVIHVLSSIKRTNQFKIMSLLNLQSTFYRRKQQKKQCQRQHRIWRRSFPSHRMADGDGSSYLHLSWSTLSVSFVLNIIEFLIKWNFLFSLNCNGVNVHENVFTLTLLNPFRSNHRYFETFDRTSFGFINLFRVLQTWILNRLYNIYNH